MSDLILSEEEKAVILRMRRKNEIFDELKDLVKSNAIEIKEIEEFVKSIKPKSNRGRKKA